MKTTNSSFFFLCTNY